MALLHQETGGDGTIDTATHSDDDFLFSMNSAHGSFFTYCGLLDNHSRTSITLNVLNGLND
jgi:hypothetical protein